MTGYQPAYQGPYAKSFPNEHTTPSPTYVTAPQTAPGMTPGFNPLMAEMSATAKACIKIAKAFPRLAALLEEDLRFKSATYWVMSETAYAGLNREVKTLLWVLNQPSVSNLLNQQEAA